MKSSIMKKPDIFDRIMDLGIMKPFRPFYIKYKMPLLYLFFGGLTTVLSIFLFWFFSLKMSPLIANIISWIVCVIFAYLTNRTWVFESDAKGLKQLGKECLSFAAGRLATLGIFLRPLERVWILLAMVYFLFNNDRAKMAGVLLDLVGVLKRIQDYCKD